MLLWTYAATTSGKFVGSDWQSTNDDALKQLFQGLQHAFFENDLARRERYLQAICYLSEFLDHKGASPEVVEEVQQLAVALIELRQGTVRPFLQPDNVAPNRTIDPNDIWLARAILAAAIELLVRHGETEVAALAFIEKDYGYLRPLLAPTAATLSSAAKGWRRHFRRGLCKSDLAQSYFDKLPWDDTTVDQLLEQVLRFSLLLDDSQIAEEEMRKVRRMAQRSISRFIPAT